MSNRRCVLHWPQWCSCPEPLDIERERREGKARADRLIAEVRATPEGSAALDELARMAAALVLVEPPEPKTTLVSLRAAEVEEEPMERVICKFRVERTSNYASGQGEVHLQAVRKSDTDNQDWSKWTPSGELRMSITNPPAMEFFNALLGKEVDIVVMPAAPEGAGP